MSEKNTRGRASKVDLLPPNIKTQLAMMLRDKQYSQSQILEEINDLIRDCGLPDEMLLSKTGLNRYASRMERLGAKIRNAREVAEIWTKQFGEMPQTDIGKTLMEMVKQIAFETSLKLGEQEGGIEPKQLALLSSAIQRLTGKRKGFELLRDGFNLYGADAKILICPEFDKTASCAAALATLADQLHAKAYIQLPKGTSLSKAIQGRGPAGTINASASNENVRHFFPYALGSSNTLESLATHAAGLRMLIDVEKGYWFSTSNKELKGVIGLEIPLTARVDDKQSETNLLNAVGITTIFNSFGTGFRLWGNRSSNFPTVTHISNFEVASRTGDIIDESIRQAELQFIDLPIDDALLDSFLETIDTFLRTQKSLVGYSVSLDYEYDLVDAFSRGQVPIVYEYTPKIPGERISNKSVMTRKYLANLVSQR